MKIIEFGKPPQPLLDVFEKDFVDGKMFSTADINTTGYKAGDVISDLRHKRLLPIMTLRIVKLLQNPESIDPDYRECIEGYDAEDAGHKMHFYLMRDSEATRYEIDRARQKRDYLELARLNRIRRKAQASSADLTAYGSPVPESTRERAAMDIPPLTAGLSVFKMPKHAANDSNFSAGEEVTRETFAKDYAAPAAFTPTMKTTGDDAQTDNQTTNRAANE